MARQRNLIHETVGAFIPFLAYAELSADDLRTLGLADLGVERVFLSPDVNSLHLVWVNGDGSIQHEVADYPYNLSESVTNFLASEIGDDAWETFEDEPDVFALLSDYGHTWTPESIPTVRLADLVAKERELTPEFEQMESFARLFAWLSSAEAGAPS